MAGNGSPVTWRELDLALAPIHEKLQEFKVSLDVFHAEFTAERTLREKRSFFGDRGRRFFGAVILGGFTAAVATAVSVVVTLAVS